MKKQKNYTRFLFYFCVIAFSIQMDAQNDKPSDIRKIINKVNNYWQSQHSPQTRSFWDDAAYHTGNIEAYMLTGNEEYRKYSEDWAKYNDWQGAKSKNKNEWKSTYGESAEYVLFGDYQICFQVYADLYNFFPENHKIARAKEVMEYQLGTARNDYWWWSDGLYMVMPVMTKMYKITNNRKYLDKLYEYLTYSDSIMFDSKANLYYRDARYVYPNHKSANGKKDFWSRGDGWVLAGLAKVLKDMPVDYKHHNLFVQKFQKMAAAIALAQQPEGYWTRSLLDPDHAPGPETSGTAFFTYAILWGINNNYLDKTTYLPIIEKSWKYLSKKALQKDGRIGYIQPIGDRAVAGQIVDANSTANFGVGAFLLAACEYTRYLEADTEASKDRSYWCETAYKIAEPVLRNMAESKLHQNMLVELSPVWDGRNQEVVYMETFGRLMAGIAPWLCLPEDNTKEGKMRKELQQWALKSYANAVNPQSADYLLWGGHGQALVDAAYIAESFLRGYDKLWVPLNEETKKQFIAEFQQLRRIDPPYTNWLLFSSTIEAFLAKAGVQFDEYRINSAIRKVDEWYVGDGWYADGPSFSFDYYSSFVFHSMYLETCQALQTAPSSQRLDYEKYYDRELRRAQKFAIILERFISPEGTFPVFGRSIPYRMAAMQPLALMAQYQRLPEGLSNGQVRGALTSVMKHMFSSAGNFNKSGYLTLGFTASQPNIADSYTNNGSLYMTSLAFMPLGLPASHPFWTDAEQDWTSRKAWGGQPFPKDHHWNDEIKTKDRY